MPARHPAVPRAAAARVRRFNRFYTRRLGLLDEGHLHSPFALPEVRVLYEVANRERPTAAAVAGALGMDAGYLSRLLRGLRHRGLLEARVVPHDRRQRVLALTARGRRTFAGLDARATAEVAAMLEDLSPAERDRLIASLETVQALLEGGEPGPSGDGSNAAAPEVALRAPAPGDLGWVVQRHGELYAEEYGWNEDFERLVARIVGEFAAAERGPRQRGWIATVDGRRAGCVFLMPGGEGVARLRLLLVEPWARGHGLGGLLVDTCVHAARRAGCHTLTLWTNDVLTAARRLYERAGFRLVKTDRHRSFGKTLTGQTWELDLARTGSAPAARRGSSIRA
ncbi:MAG TPA: helix-turn-helix domain-containing GNAT family N-acetyltransferase [Gemmatimonadales bacterium]|nr:helix-turn-helix domain-containing GNAT family N-acetyltransferase [Gemmatimonadales bacterium]